MTRIPILTIEKKEKKLAAIWQLITLTHSQINASITILSCKTTSSVRNITFTKQFLYNTNLYHIRLTIKFFAFEQMFQK